MTESEAIKEIRFNMSTIGLSNEAAKRVVEARDMAINALKEIQQYKALGTVEELRIAKEKQIPKKPNDEIKTIPILDENGAYVDADISVILLCPICGNQVGIDDCIDNYCSYCGQKLDRSDSD